VNDCREYLARHVVAAEGGEELPKGDPVNDLETIARLYLLRRCRSSSVADGSLKRSISWLAISRAFAALLLRTPGRWALGPCSVAMIDVAFLADDVGGIVVILIVRPHDVEYHRLRLIAGRAPNPRKSG